MTPALSAQWHRNRSTLFWVIALGATLTLTLLGIALYKGLQWGRMTQDMAYLADVPPYFGALSTLGLFVWAATVAVCTLGVLMLHDREGRTRRVEFLGVAAAFTGVLLLDDAFMLHDYYLWAKLKLPQWSLYAVYALFLLSYLIRYRAVILASEWFTLGAAIGFLGSSAGYDTVFPHSDDLVLFEDGLKFIGICLWLAYHGNLVRNALRPSASVRA